MSNKVTIVKTLSHLIPMHIEAGHVALYTTAYSPQLTKYLSNSRFITKFEYADLINILQKLDWDRVGLVSQPQEYSVRGSMISMWIPGYDQPIRVEFDDTKVEQIYTFDRTYGRKIYQISGFILSGFKLDKEDLESIRISDNWETTSLNPTIYVTQRPDLIPELDINYIEYDYTYPQLFWSRFDLLRREVERLTEVGYQVQLQTRHLNSVPDEILDLVTRNIDLPNLPHDLPAGFVSARQQVAVFTDREIFGTVYIAKRKQANTNSAKLLSQFEGEISVGDFVVHEDYGVAIYAGLTQELVSGNMEEYLSLKYAGDDELLIPINQVGKLTKYIGDDITSPKLSSLGKADWNLLKSKAKRAVTILAKDLINHYAERELAKAQAIAPADSQNYNKFINEFGFTPTGDQLQATNEILNDMQSVRPMNRLLVGDVGFGKTEVMMRAAFKAAEAGYQVAILCPTTVLCAQHYAVFTDRFKHFGFNIKYLSRFNNKQQNAETIAELNSGKVNIVIGTHALLSSSVKFHKLGLLIVDEEQRFGVAQKEKIKKLNYGVHHLAVSATPIPRTLGMALSNIQDISLITHAPVGRKPITTEVVKLNWEKVKQAITTEVERGGQVYFVHNHVTDIKSLESKLLSIMPDLRITVAHGQMPPDILDKRITDFYLRKSDLLLCTTIIENGIDMPNVNTIIVHQAERFGLSQLYQLRGRVGRSATQAFCYLFYGGRSLEEKLEIPAIVESSDKNTKKNVTPNYIRRLEAMAQATELGAGFGIAGKDLEIRGAGNLLGAEQHGHISQVGYALYMQLLSEQVDALKQIRDAQA